MNVEFAALPPSVVARLTELYCDCATHLISIPAFHAWSPPAVQWLAERVLTGLPDVGAYDARPIPDYDINAVYPPVLSRVYLALTYPDTDTNPGSLFTRCMQNVAELLHRHELPVYPRIAEVDALHLELTELEEIA